MGEFFGEEKSNIVFTASEDKTIKMMYTNVLKVVGVLSKHTGPVMSISFNGVTNTLISGSRDKTVIVWKMTENNEALTGKQKKEEAKKLWMSIELANQQG